MHRINDVIQLWLGIQGENKSRTIEIDMTDWIVGMPNGSPSIWIKRPGDATPTATGATFDMVTNLLTWQPDEVDTYVAGEGTAEIRMTEGTVIKKTKEIRIAVSPAVTGGGTTLGSDWQSYINEVDRLKSLATAAATAAGASEEAAETAAETATAAASAAEAARDAAQASATAAAESAATASQKASAANGAAASALNSMRQANNASESAQEAKNQAESYKNQAAISVANAQGYEYRASSYASQASSYKSQAQTSATQAAGSAETAEDAKNAAVAAKTAAEAARDAALTMIDDTAGAGDTNKVWSADKSAAEVTDLKAEIDEKADVICKTIDTPASIVTIEDGADDLPVREMRIGIEPVQEGTGDPSPDNVRPITGRTGCNVTRTGKNLVVESTISLGYVINESTGRQKDNSDHKITDFIKVVPGNTYTLSGTDLHKRPEGKTSAAGIRIGQYDENYVCVGTGASDTTSDTKTITVSNRTVYVRVQVGYGASSIQFEEGSVATDFDGYGKTYPITFPSTVYGGELTIHADGTGELVVDRSTHEFTGTENILLNASAGKFKLVNNFGWLKDSKDGQGLSNMLKRALSGDYFFALSDQIYFGWAECETVASFKSKLAELYNAGTPLVISYRLATATSYQLSAPQVRTLLGLNHIWADAGDIESITYPVDTTTAFDNQTTATHGMIAGSDSPVATESHDVGDVFICDNKLYKATDAIAVGENIIEGSNVVQTSVAELMLNRPDFVFNAAVMKNHPVSITLGNLSRAIVFATGANAERVALISLIGGSTQAYAWNIHASEQITATISGSTVTLAYSGSGSCFIDILRLNGDVTAIMA